MNHFPFFLGVAILLQGVVQGRAPAAEPQLKESKPVRSSGLDFQVVSPTVWTLPVGNQRIAIPLALKVTNPGKTDWQLETEESLTVVVKDANGKELSVTTGQDAVKANRQPAPPIVVPMGQSVTLDRSAQLQLLADGYRLVGSDGDGFWVCNGLHPGKFAISITYDHAAPAATDKTKPVDPKDAPVWVGKVTTDELAVEISEKPSK